MSKRLSRPSPALVISLIALFVALGGTVYAASKINGKNIKKGSIPGNRLKPDSVTGDQVKESSLAKVANANHADSADNATNAAKVGGRVAECPSGTAFHAGACWELNSHPKVDATLAAEDCSKKGGSLPAPLALRSYVKETGLDLGMTGEWTDNITNIASLDEYSVVTISTTGQVNYAPKGDDHQYRCILPLVH